MTGRVLSFPRRSPSADHVRVAAERLLATSHTERGSVDPSPPAEDPEILLEVCRRLRENLESSPPSARKEAEWFYHFLAEPKRAIGLFDEREYFLGEFALIAGIACRQLARREDAQRWFDRSEGNFRLTVNAVADWSRVSYQRLALLLEERKLEDLLEQVPALIESFSKLDMAEDALKCRFLEGLAYVEYGELGGAAEVFKNIALEAKGQNNDKLVATAYTNLLNVLGSLGSHDEAVAYSREAIPVFLRLGNRFGLAKVQWGLGSALRGKGDAVGATQAYRLARAEFSELGMMADVAAANLAIADILLDLKQEAQALEEVLLALPIIDEYKMVPEGMAALALLRESLKQHKVNHQALRDLHGFFEETVS